MLKKYLIIPALFLLSVSIANAQSTELKAGIVPGNPLYVLDVITEGIGNMFALGDVAKAERHLVLAGERLAEARALAEKGKSEKATEVMQKYQDKMDEAMAMVGKIREGGDDGTAASVLSKVGEATAKHQAVLAEVLAKVPEQAKDAIQNAMEKSRRGSQTAEQAVSGERPQPNLPNATSTGANGTGKPTNAGRPQ